MLFRDYIEAGTDACYSILFAFSRSQNEFALEMFSDPLGSQAYPALVDPPLTVQTNPGQHGTPSHGWPSGVHLPATSVPLRETIWGLSAALSVNESVPFKFPVLPGVKVTLTVQLAPDARVESQVFV
jgi:hypothetical protein